MTRAPAEFIELLHGQGLPLGPLAGPLQYFALVSGKLHTRKACKRLRRDRRSTLTAVSLTADEVAAADLCTGCGHQMPEPARQWGRVCEAIVAGRLQLAQVSRIPESGPCPRDVVIGLDAARWSLQSRVPVLGVVERAELDPHIQDVTERLLHARRQLAARVPDDNDLDAAQARNLGLIAPTEDAHDPHIVAVTKAYRSHRTAGREDGPFGVAAVYNRLDPVVNEERCVGFAVGSAALAAVATHVTADSDEAKYLRAWDLGPAQPGDTRETMRTATRAAAGLTRREQSPEETLTILRNALTVARGIHTTAI